jgi:hypothetical protein
MIGSRKAAQVFLLTGIVASGAFAAPLAYNINFTTNSGSPTPTSGSFTYDSAVPPGSQFTGFDVEWDGLAFDLTSNANTGGTSSGCGAITSTTVFLFLSGTNECLGSNSFDWSGGHGSTESQFFFRYLEGSNFILIADHLRQVPVAQVAHSRHGAPAGTATGPLPAPLLTNTYKLTGHTTAPLVIMQDNQVGFRGWVGLDLHSSDAPQIVWYYNNAPSNATGVPQADTVGSIVRERNRNILFGDAGTGGPTATDDFYRSITPTGPFLPKALPIAA